MDKKPVRCKGISSELDASGLIETHVLMLDLDDIDRKQGVLDLVDKYLPEGVYLVIKSSSESYHLCSLRLFEKSEVMDIKSRVRQDDAQHFKNFYRQGYNILRLTEKGDKQRPEIEEVVHKGESENGEHYFLSESHLEAFSEALDESLYDRMPQGSWIRGKITVDSYITGVERGGE